jgi:class 3 adenylate cyclase
VAEKLQAVEVMEWMNEYMQALAHLIEKHSGFINKYMGDAIMAVFGYPMINTTEAGIKKDAENAVRCALEMGKELGRLNESWARAGRRCNACRDFSDRRWPLHQRTANGDSRSWATPSTRRRLESFAKDYATDDLCRILIGDPTFELLDGKFLPTRANNRIERQRRED